MAKQNKSKMYWYEQIEYTKEVVLAKSMGGGVGRCKIQNMEVLCQLTANFEILYIFATLYFSLHILNSGMV